MPDRDSKSGAAVPEAMAPFVEALGVAAAVELCLALGYSRINVPITPADSDKLVRLAGIQTARKLSEAMAGERVYVPYCRAFLIRYLRARNHTVPYLARRLKCSEGHIYRVLRGDVHWRKRLAD